MRKSLAEKAKLKHTRILEMDIADIASLPTLRRLLARLLRFWIRVAQRFVGDQCIQRASALAYASLLAIVPVVALGFSVFTSFHAFDAVAANIRDTLLEYLLPTSRQAVESYLSSITSKTTALSIFGIIGLLVTATALLNTIESAFNAIWRITRDRSWMSKFIAFWSTLTLAPIFIGASLTVTSYFAALPILKHVAEGASLIGHIPFVVPWLMSSLALTMLYVILPNTSVPFRHAIIGGLIAGALFESAKIGFAYYVTHIANYERIYGALSTLPIFLVWLYLVWMIVLAGAEVTFCLQYPEQSHRRHSRYRRPGIKQFYAHLILLRAAQAHRQGSALSMAELLDETGIPDNILQEWLDELCRLGLLYPTAPNAANDGAEGGYLLARAANQLNLMKVFDALNPAAMKIPEECVDTTLGRMLQALYDRMDKQRAEVLKRITIEDLLDDLAKKDAATEDIADKA